MQKLMRAMHKQEEGFTLVELMVVVVIIGILVAIAIPIYSGIQERAAQSAHDANVRTLQGAASIWYAESPDEAVTHESDETRDGTNAHDVQDLETAGYIDGPAPEIPDILLGTGSIGENDEYSIWISRDGRVTIEPGIGAYDHD